ncbi:MAG: hypothetical protein RLZ47_811 [Bacteroidota bacterium]|jgi:hypothetical protein
MIACYEFIRNEQGLSTPKFCMRNYDDFLKTGIN